MIGKYGCWIAGRVRDCDVVSSSSSSSSPFFREGYPFFFTFLFEGIILTFDCVGVGTGEAALIIVTYYYTDE